MTKFEKMLLELVQVHSVGIHKDVDTRIQIHVLTETVKPELLKLIRKYNLYLKSSSGALYIFEIDLEVFNGDK